MIKVIAFDVFGTVFDMASVPPKEIKAYIEHIRKPKWGPLHLPKSWETLPAHPDAVKGIEALRENFLVVTCSNGPLGMLARLSKHNGISWDAIIPLELSRVYKTNPEAYLTVCNVFNVEPRHVAMVTANKDFGDLEAAGKLGMQPVLIRGESKMQTIVDLADALIKESGL